MAKKKFYAGGMISEDRSAVANLPQGVVMKKYPKSGHMSYSGLDDTIRVIDNQISSDASGKGVKKGSFPEKF